MLPEQNVAYALQKPVDQAITRLKTGAKVPSKTKSQLKSYIKLELGYIRTLSDIQKKLEAYRVQSKRMTDEERVSEQHDSMRLGIHMRASGLPKPHPRWEAHAIVSGAHNEADLLRAILALTEIRIDDPDNGAWLPKSERDRFGTIFPNAVVHGRTHRFHYYNWLEEILNTDMLESEVRKQLKNIRFKLQTSTFPIFVMNKKGQER